MEAPRYWNGVALQNKPIDAQLTPDASSWGWGGHIGPDQAQGVWTKTIAHKSSNYREVLTVLLSMLSLKARIENKVIKVLLDNVTTVCYLNTLGGFSAELTELAMAIWAFALDNNITVSARHL